MPSTAMASRASSFSDSPGPQGLVNGLALLASSIDGIESVLIKTLSRQLILGEYCETKGRDWTECLRHSLYVKRIHKVLDSESTHTLVLLNDTREAELVLINKDKALALKGDKRVLESLSSIALHIARGSRLKCPSCGAILDYQVMRCPSCGHIVPLRATYCPYCGARLDLKICPSCGAVLHQVSEDSVMPGERLVIRTRFKQQALQTQQGIRPTRKPGIEPSHRPAAMINTSTRKVPKRIRNILAEALTRKNKTKLLITAMVLLIYYLSSSLLGIDIADASIAAAPLLALLILEALPEQEEKTQ